MIGFVPERSACLETWISAGRYGRATVYDQAERTAVVGMDDARGASGDVGNDVVECLLSLCDGDLDCFQEER
jgi:hypothetical protein